MKKILKLQKLSVTTSNMDGDSNSDLSLLGCHGDSGASLLICD